MCVCTDIVGHHDGKQRLVMWVEGDIEGGGLHHDEDGMKDWGRKTQEKNNFENESIYRKFIYDRN